MPRELAATGRRTNKSSLVNNKLFAKIPLPNAQKVGMLLPYLHKLLPSMRALWPRRLLERGKDSPIFSHIFWHLTASLEPHCHRRTTPREAPPDSPAMTRSLVHTGTY